MLEIGVWCLTVGLIFIGLIGVVLPLIPGTLLIFLGALAHRLLLPAEISWTTVSVIGGLWLLSIAIDFGGVMVGTRCFGGSKWGMAGAGGGALVGMFFSLPALVFGTVLGAALAEKIFGKKTNAVALKAGLGAATGFALSLAARLACAVAMVAIFFVAVLSPRN